MTADLRDQLQSYLGIAYTLERELGGGGMSRVFVCEETSLERKVVVKVLPPDLSVVSAPSGSVETGDFARGIREVEALRDSVYLMTAYAVAGRHADARRPRCGVQMVREGIRAPRAGHGVPVR